MFEVALILLSALYLGPWLYDKFTAQTDPDPYDDPDNWGERL